MAAKRKEIPIPRLFRKAYSPKSLEKLLKRLAIPQDRETLRGLFEEDETGRLCIHRELDGETRRKLRVLGKAVKRNRGILSLPKLAILLALAGGVLLFNLLFKDSLVKSALERGLSAVFQAEAVLEKPRLSLLRGEFSYEALRIADRDDETRHLLETGPARFRIHTPALLEKRIRIEESSLEGFRWGTPRTPAAALPSSGKDEPSAGGNELGETLALTKEERDYRALLETQKEKLRAFALMEEAERRGDELIERWRGRYRQEEEGLKSLSDRTAVLRSLDPGRLDNPEEIRRFAAELQGLYGEARKTAERARSLRKDFEEERRELLEFYDRAEGALAEDLTYLKGFLDFSAGDVRTLASGAVEKYVRRRWEGWYEKGIRLRELYRRFQNRRNSRGEAEDLAAPRQGRVVPFPSPVAPDFLLQKFFLSGGSDETGVLSLTLENLSDDPDKAAAPLGFSAEWRDEGEPLRLAGFWDGRSEAEEAFFMELRSEDIPLSLKEGIPALRVRRIRGRAALSGETRSIREGGALLTRLDLHLSQLRFDTDPGTDPAARTAAKILGGIDRTAISLEFRTGPEGPGEISVTTDLDRLLAEGIGEALQESARQAEAELEKTLREEAAPYLADRSALSDSAEALEGELQEQLAAAEALETALKRKERQLEERAEDLLKEARKALEKAAGGLKIPGF